MFIFEQNKFSLETLITEKNSSILTVKKKKKDFSKGKAGSHSWHV